MSDLNTDNQTGKETAERKKQYGTIRNSVVLFLIVKRLSWTTTAKQLGLMCVQYVGVISTFRDYLEYIWGTSLTGGYHDCLWRRGMWSTL